MTTPFKKFLNLYEALSRIERESVQGWARDPEALKHTDHFFGKGNDDIHEPLKGGINKSEPHKAVEAHLGTTISHEDYKAGYHTDKHGRKVKIGAALTKSKAPSHLINSFANDSTRQLKAQNQLTVHTTRSREGVAGQTSAGQSWESSSCKNFNTGSNNHFLRHEVKHGTVVSYLKNHEGKELARITFQPHVNDDGQRIYKRNSYYGPRVKEFESHAKDLEKKLSASHEPTIKKYHIHPNVYDDMRSKEHDDGENWSYHPEVTSKHVEKAMDSPQVHDRYLAIAHPKATPAVAIRGLHDPEPTIVQAAIRSPHLPGEELHKIIKKHLVDDPKNMHIPSVVRAIENPNSRENKDNHRLAMKSNIPEVMTAALRHYPNMHSEHLWKALGHPDRRVRDAGAVHPNLSSDQLHSIADAPLGKFDHVKWSIGLHKDKITPEHITKLLDLSKTPDWGARSHIVRSLSDKMSSANIHQALKDPHVNVRAAGIEALNADNEHFAVAEKDHDPIVRAIAAARTTDPAHISRAQDDPEDRVKIGAAHNIWKKPEHITKALKIDQPLSARVAAAQSHNKTAEHTDIASRDPAPQVRSANLSAPEHFQDHHVMAAINDPDSTVRYSAYEKLPHKMKKHHLDALLKSPPNEFPGENARKHERQTRARLAMTHPETTAGHVVHGLTHSDPIIQRLATHTAKERFKDLL